jgi:hypothetical protein
MVKNKHEGHETPTPKMHMHKNSNLTSKAIVKQLEC